MVLNANLRSTLDMLFREVSKISAAVFQPPRSQSPAFGLSANNNSGKQNISPQNAIHFTSLNLQRNCKKIQMAVQCGRIPPELCQVLAVCNVLLCALVLSLLVFAHSRTVRLPRCIYLAVLVSSCASPSLRICPSFYLRPLIYVCLSICFYLSHTLTGGRDDDGGVGGTFFKAMDVHGSYAAMFPPLEGRIRERRTQRTARIFPKKKVRRQGGSN